MEKKNYSFIRIRRNDFTTRIVYREKEIIDDNRNKKIVNQKKTYLSVQEQREHDCRKDKIDYLRKEPEFEDLFLKGGKSKMGKDYFEEEWKNTYLKHLKKTGKKLHSKTKPFLTGLIGFTEVKKEHIPTLKKSILAFLQHKFGSSLLYSTIHTDEKTPHFHFTILNYNEETNKTFGRNIDTSLLQTELSEWLNGWEGLGNIWERGELDSDGTHEEVKESHIIEQMKIINERTIELEKQEIDIKEKLADVYSKRDKLKGMWDKLKIEEKKIEGLEKDYQERLRVVIERETNLKDKKLIKNITIYTRRCLDGRKEGNLVKSEKNNVLANQNIKKLSNGVQEVVKTIVYQELGMS